MITENSAAPYVRYTELVYIHDALAPGLAGLSTPWIISSVVSHTSIFFGGVQEELLLVHYNVALN